MFVAAWGLLTPNPFISFWFLSLIEKIWLVKLTRINFFLLIMLKMVVSTKRTFCLKDVGKKKKKPQSVFMRNN